MLLHVVECGSLLQMRWTVGKWSKGWKLVSRRGIQTEVTFAIGSEFLRHTLDDSEPIAELQRNMTRITYYQMWGKPGATANEHTFEVRLKNRHSRSSSLPLWSPGNCNFTMSLSRWLVPFPNYVGWGQPHFSIERVLLRVMELAREGPSGMASIFCITTACHALESMSNGLLLLVVSCESPRWIQPIDLLMCRNISVMPSLVNIASSVHNTMAGKTGLAMRCCQNRLVKSSRRGQSSLLPHVLFRVHRYCMPPCNMTQCDDITARQFKALHLEAMAYLMREAVPPLSCTQRSVSHTEKLQYCLPECASVSTLVTVSRLMPEVTESSLTLRLLAFLTAATATATACMGWYHVQYSRVGSLEFYFVLPVILAVEGERPRGIQERASIRPTVSRRTFILKFVDFTLKFCKCTFCTNRHYFNHSVFSINCLVIIACRICTYRCSKTYYRQHLLTPSKPILADLGTFFQCIALHKRHGSNVAILHRAKRTLRTDRSLKQTSILTIGENSIAESALATTITTVGWMLVLSPAPGSREPSTASITGRTEYNSRLPTREYYTWYKPIPAVAIAFLAYAQQPDVIKYLNLLVRNANRRRVREIYVTSGIRQVTWIQHGGQDGRRPTGMTQHEQFRAPTPNADVPKSSSPQRLANALGQSGIILQLLESLYNPMLRSFRRDNVCCILCSIVVKRRTYQSTEAGIFFFAARLIFQDIPTDDPTGDTACSNQRGYAVAERLACSPPTKANQPGHSRIFARGNLAGRCHWSAGFLGNLPFPPPLHSGARSYSPQSTASAFKASLLRATHSNQRLPLIVNGEPRMAGCWNKLQCTLNDSCMARLLTSNLGEPGIRYPAGSSGFPLFGNVVGHCCWPVGFLGDISFPPPFFIPSLASSFAVFMTSQLTSARRQTFKFLVREPTFINRLRCSLLDVRLGDTGIVVGRETLSFDVGLSIMPFQHLFHQIHFWKIRRPDLLGVDATMDG
ncbi:hypothetical protein PR048_012418 [Dryococelus australis]|uniref:Uncharacterized protein n=1 Tax=Dryococelus australis TaxID=614101 RepID=A0ABQ9HQ06_9NEOP|nr:hypothetical protein PR048_012418 [Dryococelus australis]